MSHAACFDSNIFQGIKLKPICRLIVNCFIMTIIVGFLGCANMQARPQRGIGLTRSSFGQLSPLYPEPEFLACNPQPASGLGTGVDKVINRTLHKIVTNTLSKLIDPLRNTTGKPDETLGQDELTHYFSFVTGINGPVIRIIDRTDNSIDFWFVDDAIHESNHADQAAKDFCNSRENKIAKYVGFSYKCGNTITTPLNINGQTLTHTQEERIIAYDCVENIGTKK